MVCLYGFCCFWVDTIRSPKPTYNCLASMPCGMFAMSDGALFVSRTLVSVFMTSQGRRMEPPFSTMVDGSIPNPQPRPGQLSGWGKSKKPLQMPSTLTLNHEALHAPPATPSASASESERANEYPGLPSYMTWPCCRTKRCPTFASGCHGWVGFGVH